MSVDFSFEGRKVRFQFALKRDALTLIGAAFLSVGLGAIVAPWWFPLVALALGYGGVTLDPATNWLVGIPLVLVGLACLALKVFVVDPRARRIAADKTLIAARPPNANPLAAYFAGLTTDDSFWSSADTAFEAEYTLYADHQHRLQDKKTAAAFAAFNLASRQLHQFAATNFYWFPENQVGYEDHRYCLAPDLNLDRGLPAPDVQKESEYAALLAELDGLVARAKDAYGAFLVRLRKLGHI